MKTIEELEALVETATRERDDARDKLAICTLDLVTEKRERDEARTDVECLMHQLADATNETTRVRLEAKREVEAYVGAQWTNAYRRGAEAMREACIGAACGFFMGTTGFCNGDEDALEAVLEALPIPEEP